MLELKVRKIGNSLGVVLPKEALAYLNVKEGDVLAWTEAPDGAFRVNRDCSQFDEQMTVVKDVLDRYRNTFRELAK
jgi:putative addiction module antidote